MRSQQFIKTKLGTGTWNPIELQTFQCHLTTRGLCDKQKYDLATNILSVYVKKYFFCLVILWQVPRLRNKNLSCQPNWCNYQIGLTKMCKHFYRSQILSNLFVINTIRWIFKAFRPIEIISKPHKKSIPQQHFYWCSPNLVNWLNTLPKGSSEIVPQRHYKTFFVITINIFGLQPRQMRIYVIPFYLLRM